MKLLKLTLIFELISVFSAFGQDYQSVSSNIITYFNNNSDKEVKCIRIDSVKFQTDSILYPFTVFQELNDGCYISNTASWIGKKVIVKENGENQFFNKFNEPITLKTKAELGHKWIAYQIIDSLIIEAKVIRHDTLNFLGLNDSVKTIAFQAYDKNMNPFASEINKMTLQISKNHGFVKIFNFCLFPFFYGQDLSARFEEYNLVGLSNPKVGIKNLTWLEVYDFQAGDELHIADEYSILEKGKVFSTTNKAIYKYLERTDYLDSIVYVYSRKQSIYTTRTDSSSFKFYNDTLKATLKPDLLFDKLPGEPIFIENGQGAFIYHMANEIPLSKTDRGGFEAFVSYPDSCWSMIAGEGCFPQKKYIKGLGGPYYSCSFDILEASDRKLVYYQKNGTIWGNPLIFTGTSDLETTGNIKVYPNPAGDFINIQVEGNKNSNCFIYIFDMNGKLLKYQKIDLFDSKINVSDLGTGIYIFKLTDSEHVLKIDKLIIE